MRNYPDMDVLLSNTKKMKKIKHILKAYSLYVAICMLVVVYCKREKSPHQHIAAGCTYLIVKQKHTKYYITHENTV